MNEKDFERMLDRAREDRARKLEKFQADSSRREAILTRAIQSNRVRVDYVKQDESFNPRAHFEASMQRSLRNQAKDVDLDDLLALEEDES